MLIALYFHSAEPTRTRTHTDKGVRWRGRLRGSRARRRRAPDTLALPCLRRFLAAVLRILRVRSGPSSPSFVGACGAHNPLRRSCVADFLRRFHGPCLR
jgi:hypothetical protein